KGEPDRSRRRADHRAQGDELRAVRARLGGGLGVEQRTLRCLVVAASRKLNQAESVAERVAHRRDAAPRMGLNLALGDGTGRARLANRTLDFLDSKIEMHGGPVASILA